MAKKEIGFNKPAKKPSRAIKSHVQLYRTTTDLNAYRSAVMAAENIQQPNRMQLYQLYQAAALDPHITACIQQAKNHVLGSSFCVYQNEKGKDGKMVKKENEVLTQKIRKKWFRDFVDYALDTPYWGHTLPQFGDVITGPDGNLEFKDVEIVPREYVSPEFHTVMHDLGSSPQQGEDYLENPYKNWCIGIGKPRDLGLFLKLTPLYIWKKNALGAWAEYVEKFGVPIRVLKAGAQDDETKTEAINMLRNMGTSLWMLLRDDDQFELHQPTNQDAYEVFDKMVERCNSEISKLILGQTMTTDDGSSRSQAEVHERVVDAVGEHIKQFIYSVLNDQLVPLMNFHGFGLENCYIDLEQEDEFDLQAKADFDIALINSGKFTLTPEYIKEKYGTEVVKVEEPKMKPDAQLAKYKNVLSQYYD